MLGLEFQILDLNSFVQNLALNALGTSIGASLSTVGLLGNIAGSGVQAALSIAGGFAVSFKKNDFD